MHFVFQVLYCVAVWHIFLLTTDVLALVSVGSNHLAVENDKSPMNS